MHGDFWDERSLVGLVVGMAGVSPSSFLEGCGASQLLKGEEERY